MIVVLDTNALVWAFEGSKSLGRRAEQAIDDAVTGGTAHVSAISFWELALKNGIVGMAWEARWRVGSILAVECGPPLQYLTKCPFSL